MAKEICISSTPHETRLAILEDDQLAEIYYERENEYTLAGSVYKGRVTRVLPGMQSAFVDIGLERDAFLYVTDFLEMEDPEDSDEVERAASQGDTVRPQQQSQGRRDGRSEGRSEGGRERGRRGEPRPAQEQSSQPTRLEFEPLASGEMLLEGGDFGAAETVAHETPAGESTIQEQIDEQEPRRWRGRRRRRGGRGRDEAEGGEVRTEGSSAEEETEEDVEEAAPLAFSASAMPAPRAATPAQTPFVLPGESLSKYGASAPAEPSASRLILTELPTEAAGPPLPPRTVTRPSTLVEHELHWDGSGLLPGESLSRRRQEPPVSEPVYAEPTGVFAERAPAPEVVEAAEAGAVEHPGDVEEFVEEEWTPTAAEEAVAEQTGESVEVVEAAEAGAIESPGEIAESPLPHAVEEGVETHGEAEEESESEGSASHNVDPLPPSHFRFKDLFSGGRRREEEPEPVPQAPEPKPVASVSAYAPGNGLVEEEVIEEEEYEFNPLKAHAGDEHDLEELEEETLQQQIRSGALGEMLEEAQFEHRLEEDEEESSAPVRSEQQGGRSREGRERSGERGRGRRGRGGESRGEGRSDSRGDGRSDSRRGPSRRSAQTTDLPIISDLLKPGQEVLVQIAKEPIAKKGARITSHIALPGRFLVFMPTVSHVGVSRKIASDEERQRLKRILVSEKGEATGGFIVRTAAEGATEDELRADLRFLINLWNDIKQRADASKPPALIYHDLSLIERILRDQVSDNFSHIWVDSEADYERIVRFLNRFSPELVRRVKLYTKEIPLFEHFGIQDEISKALRSKVWLKSGGSIVINQTEALVAIDINTGKYVGKTARLEDTILKTNLDAIPEIVRQIRLRDLGGIIVIDFIDMDERKNRSKVMAALEEALKQDRAPTKVLQFNDFGLVAITRKRVKQSLERTLSVPCPICQATGMVKSPATVCNEIYTEVRKMRRHFDQTEVLLRVNPETAKVLKANNARWLTQLEELAGKNVLIKSDPTLHPEQFDIQG
jgi:Rne/Rng family ribonuclease